jgi:hypothetical protein
MSGGYYDPSPPIPHGAVHLLCCSGLLCTRIDECDYEIMWSPFYRLRSLSRVAATRTLTEG